MEVTGNEKREMLLHEFEKFVREHNPGCTDYNQDMLEAVHDLLEAQEQIAPHDYDPVIYGHRYTCGNCHHSLWRNDNYCSQCGKAVMWE